MLPSRSRPKATLPPRCRAISEILSRLPVKPLCRFRCVSRGWSALISDPAFVTEHRTRAAEPLIVTYSFHEHTLRLIDMDGKAVRVIHGLDWFELSISSREDDLVCVTHGSYGTSKVMDIATGKVLVTCLDARVLGFGRAVPSGLYKLVRYRVCKCEILTVGDPIGWRKKLLPSSIIACYSDTITINGVVYLFVHIVFRFDLESEEWRKAIRGPAIPKKQLIKVSLAELDGSLCVGATDPFEAHGGWEIWLLDVPAADDPANNSVWVKAYSISSTACMSYCELTPLKVRPPDGEKLLFVGNPAVPGLRGGPLLQVYDRRDGTCTDVKKMADGYAGNNSLCSLHLERFV